MPTLQQPDRQAHILWVYSAPAHTSLDSATWLRTTDELRRRDWKVTLVSPGPRGSHTINGVQIDCISMPSKYVFGPILFHIKLLWFILRRWRTIDILLFHQMAVPWLLPLRLLRIVTGDVLPLFIMDTRDLNAVDGSLKNYLRIKFFDLMHWFANRWTDGQTTITQRMAELVHVPPEQLWGIWPSGVDLDLTSATGNNRRWPAANEPIELIYIGKLHSERGLLPLCQAVEQVTQEGMHFRLTLVGSGPQREELLMIAANTEGRIHVLPPVEHKEIPALLQQSHIGVTSLPGIDNAKFQASSPIKLFEYMAAGLPILSTKNYCHTQVVGTGNYAFWAQDADLDSITGALRMVWTHRAVLSILGHEAEQSVQGWTWSAAGEKLSNALHRGLFVQLGKKSVSIIGGNGS